MNRLTKNSRNGPKGPSDVGGSHVTDDDKPMEREMIRYRHDGDDEFEDDFAPDWDQSESDESCDFADPGGKSALRAATEDNPRNLPCPNCGAENRLTPADSALGYQCDACADRTERGYD
jgi:hypothetical protein